MATKRKKKPVPQHEGRMLKGYGDDGVHYGEQIERDLDDAGVRAMGEKAKKLLAQIGEKEAALAGAKREVADLKRQESECVRAMVERREYRYHHGQVYLFADDAAGTVSVYDAETDELLCVRKIEDHERQESMDLDGDADAGEDEE